METGHPYKLNKVVNGAVPTFPHSDIDGALELVQASGVAENALGIPASYNEATYVIGGFGWKARWIDAEGYIVTGTKIQYNLEGTAEAGNVLDNYDAGKYGAANGKSDKSYTCGNCHTTGWRPYDENLNPHRQDDLPGMTGTFVAGGVHCESCHGAGAAHVASLSKDDIVRVATARTTAQLSAADQGFGLAVTCGECHTRDGEKNSRTATPYVSPYEAASGKSDILGGRIISNGTIGKHHQTYDELLGVDPDTNEIVGKKLAAGMTCITCHDPHKSTRYGAAGAIKTDCLDCHGAGKANPVAMPSDSAMAGLDCTTCHMPYLVKSAIWTGTNKAGAKMGDIKTHVFKIDLSKTAQLTEDKKFVYPWITADYACGSCHAVPGFGFDLAEYKFHQAAKWEPAPIAEFAGGATYVGSDACIACHNNAFFGQVGDDFKNSGHPYKLNKVVNGAVPTYPHSDITGALELVQASGSAENALGIPASYDEVTYVIGGFGWKARWLDADGYIVTGTKVQYNLAGTTEAGNVLDNYDAGKFGAVNGKNDKSYTCGNCHTTGWRPYDLTLNPNRQDDLPGMAGTFVETGIGCESCHGAGSDHAARPTKSNIVKVAAGRSTAALKADDQGFRRAVACGECHTRDGERHSRTADPYVSGAQSAGYDGLLGGRIVANGTIAKHHEQYDELLGLDINEDGSLGDGGALGLHLQFGVGCNSCHNPHKSTKYGVEGAVKNCSECHVNVGFNLASHSDVDCITCHMPALTKNAIWGGTNAAGMKVGDIKTHIFKIDVNAVGQLTPDTKWVYPRITAEYACGTCHTAEGDFSVNSKVQVLNADYGGKVHK